MKTIAFFDSKKYDIEAFETVNGGRYELRWYDTKLSIDSVELARGKDAVCCFVNDTVDRAVIDRLCDMGIGLLLVRCAGYNMSICPRQRADCALCACPPTRRTLSRSMRWRCC